MIKSLLGSTVNDQAESQFSKKSSLLKKLPKTVPKAPL